MTRNTGDNYQESPYGYPPQQQYGQSQPQYGQSQQPYSSYGSGQGQGYGHQEYQQPSNYGSHQGSAQSYYGGNDQPYQQYPNDRPPYPQEGQHYQGSRAPSYTPAPQYNQQYGDQDQYAQNSYGGPQPSHEHPPHGQQYYPPHHMQQPSAQVDEFRSHFDQPSVSSPYGQPTGQHSPGPDGDRGIMGALAGGAAGAYGGHKMNHGILGGLGGAVAGSMLQDTYKKHHKKPKSRRGSSSSSSSSSSYHSKKNHHPAGAVTGGNFHSSSKNVYLEGRSTLVAECCDTHGHHRRSAIDLNDVFTNTNGTMQWARGGNFAASARNLRLTEHGNFLEAELGDGRGGWRFNRVDLNERISNEDGRLVLV